MRTPPTESGSMNPIVVALMTGWLLGALDVVLTLGGLSPNATGGLSALAVLFGAILATIPALGVGLVFWGGGALFRRTRFYKRVVAWVARVETKERYANREPVIRAQAFMIALVVAIGIAAIGSRLIYPRLFTLQVTELATEFAMLFAAGLVFAMLLFAVITIVVIHEPLRALDKRVRLPLPRPLWARYLLVVTVPMFAALYPFLLRHGAAIAYVRDALVVLLLACGTIQGWLLLASSATLRSKRATLVVAALGVVMFALGAFAYLPAHAAAIASEQSLLASMGGRLGRALSDVDRDGASSMFGGRDCAPFDGSRAPSQTEIAGNGIDEDCDGLDAARASGAHKLDHMDTGLDAKSVRNYNIVLIIVESLRADHIPAWGFDKPTMPYLSEFARGSLMFREAYSQSSATIYSLPSILTGVIPGALEWYPGQKKKGVYGSGQPQFHAKDQTLAERLKTQKYTTGLVIENYVHNTMESLRRSFDRVYVTEPDKRKKINRERRNPYAVAHVADFLARQKANQPFFLTTYLVDSHGPYRRHRDIDSSKFSRDQVGNYHTEMAWTDETIRAITEVVRARRKMWANTIVIITADHGEEFNEHGNTAHARTCHVEVTHVPLVMRIPRFKPQRIDARVALVDIAPTVLELTGNKTPRDRLSGQSLLIPALKPERLDPNRPVFCSMATVNSKKGVFFRRSVRQGDFALFQYVTEGRVALFNTRSDRGEHIDLSTSPEQRARVESLTAMIQGSLTGNLRDHKQMAKERRR